jgi:hypothetical protein
MVGAEIQSKYQASALRRIRLGRNLDWLVNEKQITPHTPVIDKSKREDGTYSILRHHRRESTPRALALRRHNPEAGQFFDVTWKKRSPGQRASLKGSCVLTDLLSVRAGEEDFR